MQIYHCTLDASVMYAWHTSWSGDKKPTIRESPTPLTFAALERAQFLVYKEFLAKENWECLGWYYSCHYPIDSPNRYPVYLFKKENPKNSIASGEAFFRSGGLGCSVCFLNWQKPSAIRVFTTSFLGLGNPPTKTITLYRCMKPFNDHSIFTDLGFRKVAETSIAVYWLWANKPEEEFV